MDSPPDTGMILSQPDLRAAVASGQIGFDPPLEERQWGEASIDLRLGFQFTKFRDKEEIKHLKLSVAGGLQGIGDLNVWKTKLLTDKDDFGKPETFCIDPSEFILALTYESIEIPNHLIGLVEGRSTYARVGLSMHLTAPWIQPGWRGPIILEMINNGPLRIELTPVTDRPCQITFFQLSSPLTQELVYGAKGSDTYQHQTHPLQHGKRK